MHQRQRVAAGVLLAGLVCAGCTTTQTRIWNCSAALQTGHYADAARVAEPAARSGRRDAALWLLYAGGARLLEGRLTDTVDALDAAEAQAHDLARAGALRGAGHAAAGLLVNDRALPYRPSGHELIFCNLYKALAFAAAGRHDDARVEFNRALQRQWNHLDNHAAAIAAEEERLQGLRRRYQTTGGTETLLQRAEVRSRVAGTFGVDLEARASASAKDDFTNPYLLHVAGIFRWLNGDDGNDALRLAAELLPDNESVRRDSAEAGTGRPPRRQVWVYVEDGLGPRREERRLDLPLGLVTRDVLYTGCALPALVYQPAAADGYRLAGGGQAVPMRRMTDVDRLVKRSFDAWFRYALLREATRVVVKTAAQVSVRQSRHDTDYWAPAVLALYQAVTTAADVRSWAGLPKQVFGARLAWPDDGMLELTDSHGRRRTIPLGNGNNALVWVRIPGAQAEPAVLVIRFP